MTSSRITRPENISKIVGALFIGISLYLLFFTPYTTGALGALFIGIFTPVIMHGRFVEEETAAAGMKSGIDSLHILVQDLNLRGNAVVVPSIRHLSESRTYIPAGDFDTLPQLYDEMTIITEGGGRTGISLVPTGYPIYREAQNRMDYEFRGEGLESARELMGHLTHGLDLASSFSVRREAGEYRVRITQGRYMEHCEGIRKDRPGICLQGGCPLCSAYLVSLAECVEKPLRIKDFEADGKHMKYTLEEVS